MAFRQILSPTLGNGLAVPFLIGGVGAIVVILFFLWAGTNLGTMLICPREYKIWKKGGGDPFFDTLDPPLNNDPDSVRYQELYREKARLECEQVDRMFGVPPKQPQAPKAPPPSSSELSFDDPHFS